MKNNTISNNRRLATKKLKYRLCEYMNKWPKAEYSSKMEALADDLSITTRTLYNWATIPLGSHLQIPEGSLAKLAQHFGLKSESEMRNYIPTINRRKRKGASPGHSKR